MTKVRVSPSMAIGQRQAPAVHQRWLLTARLLSLCGTDLAVELRTAVDENPFLEFIDPDSVEEESTGETEPTAANDAKAEDKADEALEFFGAIADECCARPRLDTPEPVPLENTLAAWMTLADHLTAQLSVTAVNDHQREICDAIIGNLDEAGYLEAGVDEIAALGPWDEGDVREAIALVQKLDPPGVAATDLKECLLLQLKRRGLENSPCSLVIAHLEDLKKGGVALVAVELGATEDAIHECLRFVWTLDPSPGARFWRREASTATPDVTVSFDKASESFVATSEDHASPRLRVAGRDMKLLSTVEGDAEARTWLRDRLVNAKQMIEALEYREKTIVKVARTIANLQRDFLLGVGDLRRLILADVAKVVGLHVTTIQRAVAGKFVATPVGLYELAYFFSSGLSSTDGTEVSSRVVRQRVRHFIEQEDPSRPLSDNALVRLLEESGVRVSRRAVSNYREAEHIPASNARAMWHAHRQRAVLAV